VLGDETFITYTSLPKSKNVQLAYFFLHGQDFYNQHLQLEVPKELKLYTVKYLAEAVVPAVHTPNKPP
jgi:hypothetical protein